MGLKGELGTTLTQGVTSGFLKPNNERGDFAGDFAACFLILGSVSSGSHGLLCN